MFQEEIEKIPDFEYYDTKYLFETALRQAIAEKIIDRVSGDKEDGSDLRISAYQAVHNANKINKCLRAFVKSDLVVDVVYRSSRSRGGGYGFLAPFWVNELKELADRFNPYGHPFHFGDIRTDIAALAHIYFNQDKYAYLPDSSLYGHMKLHYIGYDKLDKGQLKLEVLDYLFNHNVFSAVHLFGLEYVPREGRVFIEENHISNDPMLWTVDIRKKEALLKSVGQHLSYLKAINKFREEDVDTFNDRLYEKFVSWAVAHGLEYLHTEDKGLVGLAHGLVNNHTEGKDLAELVKKVIKGL